MLAKAPADHTGCVFSSNATLANSRNDTQSNSTNDLMRKGSSFDKTSIVDSSTRTSHAPRYNETPKNNGDPRSEYLGSSSHKGIQTRNWKKQLVIDENRRDTYKQPILSAIGQEPSVLTVFDLERKQLAPVGFHMEHSYARSLARFAANLGPLGWEIAAKRIQRALPPGIKFGRGWVGDNEAPPPQPSLPPAYPHISTQMKILHCSTPSGGGKLMEGPEPSSIDSSLPPSASSASAVPALSRSTDSVDGVEACKTVNPEGKLDLADNGMGPKSHCKNSTVQPCMNGLNPRPGVNLPSQTRKSVSHTRPPEELMPHARVISTVCRNGDNSFGNHHAPLRRADAEEKTTIHSGSTLRDGDHRSGGHLGALSMNPKPSSIPTDLNADFQSPGSPVAGILADPQEHQQQRKQPDLALQL
ncbi:bromodomain-containing protein [Iris pallida]|uniref:Bromodomain-containing protein n=1 Tax=Iris pallida TaxID=29817 RepID=A0AAX6GH43_IRIPA|nr:bromodomain-containing protein [Iris pallida]